MSAAVWADYHSCFVASVFSLHEQRVSWSSRLDTESVARRAVYNNNTGGATSGERQPPQPMRRQVSDQQHAIFGKWLHHRGTTVQYGGRDFRWNCHFVVQKQDNEEISSVFGTSSLPFRTPL